ncbi:hypothetical protein N7495_002446 [Penicillium taxi]|uniref:uncharacterized protein n=1 Tax=Penicillium taxi TaxID=168475 RepID=UPI002545A323|nr:uncharacterized protein N7495_002446 [Penicillium taxi]KAJ5901918.1 hypothetical protein N7495_002446 [Penicillium taxi]
MKSASWALAAFLTSVAAKSCSTKLIETPSFLSTVATSVATSTATVTVTETASSTWPWSNPTYTPYASVSPLPDDIDLYTAYAKIMASTVNETYAWWYMGLSTVLAGVPEMPGLKSQTIQVFRVQHYNESTMRIDWTEMIGMGDFNSNEYATNFYNPLTGVTNNWTTYLNDGPASWVITRIDRETVNFELIQSSATVLSATINGGVYDGRIIITHIESKYRPSTTQADLITYIQSSLLPIGSLAEVRNNSVTSAKGTGMYYAFLNGTVSTNFGYPNGTQGDTHITGNIIKGGKSEAIYPYLWKSCKKQFPSYFNKKGELDPDWDTILSE